MDDKKWTVNNRWEHLKISLREFGEDIYVENFFKILWVASY